MRTWLEEALNGTNYRRFGFESVTINNLLDDYSEATALDSGFRLLGELVEAYADVDEQVIAWAVFDLGLEDELVLEAPDVRKLASVRDRSAPPTLYVQKRFLRPLSPYVVEEYKKPYPADTFRAPHGVYHTYYRCHRQDDVDEFARAIYVEHYPHS
ncbi:hypothetical protein GCM10009660_04780 [Catellatospora bangladeshensis]